MFKNDCSLTISQGLDVNVIEDTHCFIYPLGVSLLVYTSNQFVIHYRLILPKYKYCLWKKRAEIYLMVFYIVIGVTVTNLNFLLKSSHVHNNVIKVLYFKLENFARGFCDAYKMLQNGFTAFIPCPVQCPRWAGSFKPRLRHEKRKWWSRIKTSFPF